MLKLLATTLAIAVGSLAGAASAQTVVSGNITSDTTWGSGANPSPIILDVAVFVKDGATLTIEPGTIVRGQPRSGPVLQGNPAGTPGALIVTQTGRIVANATPDAPIIMTTAAVDNDGNKVPDDVDGDGFEDPWTLGDAFLDADPANDDGDPTTGPLALLDGNGNDTTGLWGGVVVLGNAPTNNANKAGVGYGKTLVEGLTVPGFPAADASYGGVLPHDNSGVLRYVSIRHAGDELGNGNELNGLSLGGVGDGTTVEFIEVYANFDDGVEWFGGTVNGSHLAAFYVGDDSFDVDEGYTGVNQFLFGIQTFFNENDGEDFGSKSGDKAGEFDGDNFRPDNASLNDNLNVRLAVNGAETDPTPWPLSNPAFYNMTIIGSTPPSGAEFTPVSPASVNRGVQFRNGFAGEVLNSIIVNTADELGNGETCIEVDTGIGDGAPGFDALNNANAGLIALVSSTCDDSAPLAPIEQTVVANGDAKSAELGAFGNTINDAPFPFAGLVNEDATFDPQGTNGMLVPTLKAAPINPRAQLGGSAPPTVGGGVPPIPGLDAVTFRGAFSSQAGELWTGTWTTLGSVGLLQ